MPFNVAVIGTGIAGLGAAIALTAKGHAVTILEATTELRPIGGIIVLQANANRVLDGLGAYEQLKPFRCHIPHGPSTRDYKGGEYLCRVPADTHEKDYGYPLLALHRADLQQVLYNVAMKRNIDLRLGCRVVDVEESGHILAVILASGERVEADLVVGADGVDSTVRRTFVPDSECVRDSGLDITRATVPAATVRSNLETSAFMDQIDLWCGPSTSIAAMAVRRGDELLLGLDCCHPRNAKTNECKSRKQDMVQFRAYFKEYTPAIQKILSYVKEAYVWKLKETMPSSWNGKTGRIALIGDAAHGSLPWVGQGGGMALEDAVTLAECLDRAADRTQIPKVTRAFQEIRQPRCVRVQEWSARKGRRATLPDGPERIARDLKLKLVNAWVKADPWDNVHVDELPDFESPNWKAWLSGHNAVDFAKRELDKRFGRHQDIVKLFVKASVTEPCIANLDSRPRLLPNAVRAA